MENELSGKNAIERMQASVLSMSQFAQVGTAIGSSVARVESRFSELGVRACRLYFACVLVGMLAYALVANPGDFVYDFSLVHGLVAAALYAICIWLFQKRAREARTFAIASTVACVVLSSTDMFLFGAFDVMAGRLGAPVTTAVLAAQYCLAAAVVAYLAAGEHAGRFSRHPASGTRL